MARRLRPCPRNRSISGATVARAFCHARKARSGGGWDVEGRITKLHPARPSFSQGGAGTLGNHLALVLGDGGEDVQGKPVGGRHVHGDELDPALHEARDEGDIAGQPVELGDDQRGPLPLAGGDRGMKFGPVVLPGALDLGEFGEDVAATGGEIRDGPALGLQTEAACARDY
ncbi:MAG: hypothetical protein WAS21_29490 [Geminicoccaceae bacterium]